MSVVVSVNLIRVAIHWNIFRSIPRLELAHCKFALIHRSVLMGCRAARAARAMHSVASVAYIGYRFLHSPSHFTIKIQVTHFVCTTRTEWINKYTKLEQRVYWMLAVHRMLQMATDTKLKWQVWTEHGVWIHRALDIFGLLPTLAILPTSSLYFHRLQIAWYQTQLKKKITKYSEHFKARLIPMKNAPLQFKRDFPFTPQWSRRRPNGMAFPRNNRAKYSAVVSNSNWNRHRPINSSIVLGWAVCRFVSLEVESDTWSFHIVRFFVAVPRH